MAGKPIAERAQLAGRIRALSRPVAVAVTEEFLARHPDWVTRYGERARQLGVEDALFHLDFLAAAIEAGETEAFAGYLRWTAGVLEARGIATHFLHENVEQIARELGGRLSADQGREVIGFAQSSLGSTTAASPKEPTSGAQDLYLQAILRGQRQAAVGIAVETVRQGRAVTDVYADILQESMYEVGRLWEHNRITVAQEHMATAITQYVIAQLYPLIPHSQALMGRMVITGVEGEHHQVGPNIVADALEADGWDVRFLGVNTPIAGVLRAIEEHRAEVLGISATMLFNLPKVRRLIEEARALPGLNLRIILGGSAFRAAPRLCEELGASGVALDVRAAVRLAAGLAASG